MKRKLLSIILSAALIFSMTGCGKSSDDSGNNPFSSEQTTEDTGNNQHSYSSNDIILISNYSNYAWGYQQSGWFVTGAGEIYSYDFSRDYIPEYVYSDVNYSFIDILKIIQTYSEPTATCDAELIDQIYNEGVLIDPDAKYITENVACDAGQSSIQFYNHETDELIKIAESGDTDVAPTDKHAKTIQKLTGKISFKSTGAEDIALFTPNDYYFGHANCGYLSGADGDYVLFNEGELLAFKELTGIDVTSLLQDDFDPDTDGYGSYVYFINVTNTPTLGYNIEYDTLLKQGDCYQFIPSENYSVPDENDTVAEALDGFINLCALRTYYDDPYDFDYLDKNGNPFKRLEAPEGMGLGNGEFDFPEGVAGEYYFASGAGAWSTDLTLHEDGSFEANYHDSDMGDFGDGYDATVYVGSCSGKFRIIGKVDEYMYEMSVEITEHSETTGEYYESLNGSTVRYVNSDVYGIDGGSTFLLILEGAPMDELPTDYIGWVSSPHAWGNDVPTTLPFNGIYNVEDACGFGQ